MYRNKLLIENYRYLLISSLKDFCRKNQLDHSEMAAVEVGKKLGLGNELEDLKLLALLQTWAR